MRPSFFGRTKAVGEILNSLRRQEARGKPFLLIVGASGSGKSSLIQAGVLPLLMTPGVVPESDCGAER
jgi:ABC-type lipoprotein export system ATPase subunit